jgi:hypothetical protein
MPILILVVIIKYLILACRRFKTSKKLFYSNLIGYTLFLIVVILLDYRKEIFGETCPTPNTFKTGDILSKVCRVSFDAAIEAAKQIGATAANNVNKAVKTVIVP